MTPGNAQPIIPNPHRANAIGRGVRGVLGVALVAGLAAVGCKSRETGGGLARGGDPLMGGPGRIPPQNVPVPDRGTAGGKGKTDPLVTPVTRPSEKTGVGYTNDPDRFKGPPYVPNSGTVPAALAGQPKDGDELKIPSSGGVPLRPAGGSVPADTDAAAVADRELQQLQVYGVTRGNYGFEHGDAGYVFRAKVPEKAGGAAREFVGTGATPTDAVKQVLDQLKADRGR
jgi:hypothetical protein